jgi:hypothetical protein
LAATGARAPSTAWVRHCVARSVGAVGRLIEVNKAHFGVPTLILFLMREHVP